MFFKISSTEGSESFSTLESLKKFYQENEKIMEKMEFGLDRISIEMNKLLDVVYFKLVNCTFHSEYLELGLEKPNITIAIGLYLKTFGLYLSPNKKEDF